MGFGNASLLLKINFILLILAVIIQILGLALPYWINDDATDFHSGLWQACSSGNCQTISSLDWLEASQAFSILGAVVLIVALVLVIVVIFVKNMKMLKLIIWILAFVAALFIMIEFAVYVEETGAQSEHYSGAFAITIVDFVLCLVIGVIGLVDWFLVSKGK